MNNLHPQLLASFDRDLRLIGNDPFSGPLTLGVVDVLKAHYLMCDHFLRSGENISQAGVRDIGLLISAVARQHASFGGVVKWKQPLEQLSTLFFGIVKNHAFHDGNKRTGLLSLLFQLHKNCRVPDCKQTELDLLAVRTAGNQLDKYSEISGKRLDADDAVKFIADWVRRKTRKLDKAHYVITFRQLAGILKRFGFEFTDPDNSYIKVVTIERERYMKWFSVKEREYKRTVVQIAFPGWDREVPRQTLTKIRKAAKLTPENDCDSLVFFKDTDPLPALITTYEGPLRRLKDK